MVRTAIWTTAVLLAAWMLCGDVLGHGGQIRGPAPTLPPGMGKPPIGPNTPLPGGGPTTPGGGPGPVTGGGAYAAKKPAAPDYTGWDTWWEFNKEPYLQLRARLGTSRSVTGVGRSGVQGGSVRPGFDELRDTAVPALRAALKSTDSDVVDSAVLALGRITPREEGAAILPDILAVLKNDDATVQRAALLALGVLGHDDAVPVLTSVLKDDAAGRSALAIKGRVPDVMRGYAAIALGLVGSAEVRDDLIEMVRSSDDDVDRKALAILALGLAKVDRPEVVRFLADELKDSRQEDVVRAQIPIALSRLGDDAALLAPTLLQLARNKRVKDPVRRSCVIALGRLVGPEDADVRDGLIGLAKNGNDDAVTHFAFIALGEIGARAAAEPARGAEYLKEVVRFLLRQVDRPETKDRLPFAATAAAILGRQLPPDDESRVLIARKMREAFDSAGNPMHQSALAVCLGLLEDEAGAGMVRKELKSTGDEARKGYFAVALGLMRDEESRALLREELADATNPGYRAQVAVGLGLLGDPKVSDDLTQDLAGAKTLYETSSITKALGLVGDRGAVAPLVALVDKSKKGTPGLTRAFSCVALGLLGEKTELPWNTPLAVGSNYLATFFGQSEILDIL